MMMKCIGIEELNERKSFFSFDGDYPNWDDAVMGLCRRSIMNWLGPFFVLPTVRRGTG